MVRRPLILALAVSLCGSSARAEDAAAPAAGVAADGTASVVVTEPDPPPGSAADAASDPRPPGPRAADGVPLPSDPATPREPPALVPPPDPTATAPAGVPGASGAAALLAAVLAPAEPAPAGVADLYARPLPLLEALTRPGDPARRLWIAQAYWKVSSAHAWLRWSAEAVDRLELVAPGGDPHDRAVLDVATAAARADLAEARSQLGVAQQELVDLARLPITEPLPWPVDRPLASPYQTHFDAIFATRVATGRTRAIARTLPARHEALESRAAAVVAAGRALEMAEADHARGRRPIEAVVAAHAALTGQQREFLAAVRAYNTDVAEYAMAVADVSVPDDLFVSMLIEAPAAVRPAAATAPVDAPAAVPAGGPPAP